MEGMSETLQNIEGMLDEIQDYYEENGNLKLNEIERIFILNALKLCNNNRTKTAKMVNISIRTIRNKLNEYKSSESI